MLPLLSATIFLSALLLFLAQPMIARVLLPPLGGSPAVWNTCMLFFQAALLAGYAWAHAAVRLGTRRHASIHVAALAIAGVALFWLARATPPDPAEGASPVGWLLSTLAITIGAPFFALAATAPLIQRWFGESSHTRARDPYFLYAASNAGSLLALIAYPAVIEWLAGLETQRRLWAAGYALVAALVAASAFVALRRPAPPAAVPSPPHPVTPSPHHPPTTARQRLLWVALAAVPSSLMLGVTQYLSTDVAAVPLLWIVPLGIYLLTFIIAFAARPLAPLPSISRLLPMLALGLAVAMILQAKRPIWILFIVHLLAFTLAALLCHVRLARERPPPARLTEFYLLVAVGGALGGLFNALLAPAVFQWIAEYPIALVAACAFRIRSAETTRADTAADRALDVALPLSLIALALGTDRILDLLRLSVEQDTMLWRIFGVAAPALLCFLFVRRPLRFALGLGALMWLAHAKNVPPGELVARDRTFFGVYQVVRDSRSTALYHGTTMHGEQFRDPARHSTPLSYYHPEGPIGDVFKAFGDSPLFDRLGLVGLGSGSLAAYGRPGQTMTFFEIDPAVVRIARDPECFTYLTNSAADKRFVIGDARVSLRRAPEGEFGLVVLDAFTSDAIPVHLVTREAVALYLSRLAPRGLLAFHISNQYVELSPVLARIASDLGLVTISRADQVDRDVAFRTGRTGSTWVLLARDRADFGPLAADSRWLQLRPGPGAPLWTDDYSNIFTVFKWD